MKKQIILVFILIAAIVVFLLLCGKQNRNMTTESIGSNQSDLERTALIAAPAASERTNLAVSSPATQAVGPVSAPIDKRMAEQIHIYVEGIRADPTYTFKRPVNFYGKVLDESDQPVSGASIEFSWSQANAAREILSKNAEATTDSEGLFSLKNETGDYLSVAVGKSGYYKVGQKPWFDYPGPGRTPTFEYADPSQIHTPDSKTPVVFRLRKKGKGAALIISQQGIRTDVRVVAPRDGSPVKVDLLKMKVANEGTLEFSQVKPEAMKWKQANEWSFQMTIRDGGFVEYQNQEFPFEAPETGYEPTVKFEFQKAQSNWVTSVTKDYYFRFGTPPMYGRLHLEASIDGAGALIKYAINPNAGSRNLEHDESLKPKQTVFE